MLLQSYIDKFIYYAREERKVSREIMSDLDLAQIATDEFNKGDDAQPPKLAATCHFSRVNMKHQNVLIKLNPIVNEACHVFGVDPKDCAIGDSADWRNVRSIVCYIAIKDVDIRPHTPIRDKFGLNNNGAVQHACYRADRLITENVMFLEKLMKVRANLGITEPIK